MCASSSPLPNLRRWLQTSAPPRGKGALRWDFLRGFGRLQRWFLAKSGDSGVRRVVMCYGHRFIHIQGHSRLGPLPTTHLLPARLKKRLKTSEAARKAAQNPVRCGEKWRDVRSFRADERSVRALYVHPKARNAARSISVVLLDRGTSRERVRNCLKDRCPAVCTAGCTAQLATQLAAQIAAQLAAQLAAK
jgi:hypothetical protein